MFRRDYNLSQWLNKGAIPAPCSRDLLLGAALRLYVYSLPWAYHGQIVDHIEMNARKHLGVTCNFLREDCSVQEYLPLANMRSHCSDVPILSKLVQSCTIVHDPHDADIFLVPFLLGCNAMLSWGHGLKRVNPEAHHTFFNNFSRFAREMIPFFASVPHRHLFLFPIDSMFIPKSLHGSIVAHTGARYVSGHRLDITVPYYMQTPIDIADREDTLASYPEEGSEGERPISIFMMADLDRNWIRKEIFKQLEQKGEWSHSIELWKPYRDKMPLSVGRSFSHMRRSQFCMAPTGDSDGFTQRLYSILLAGCIPVRVDTYYPQYGFGNAAWPFKQSIDWSKAVILVPPKQLRRVGLVQTLRAIPSSRCSQMRRYITNVVQRAIVFNLKGESNDGDAFTAFLHELIELTRHKLPSLDSSQSGNRFGRFASTFGT